MSERIRWLDNHASGYKIIDDSRIDILEEPSLKPGDVKRTWMDSLRRIRNVNDYEYLITVNGKDTEEDHKSTKWLFEEQNYDTIVTGNLVGVVNTRLNDSDTLKVEIHSRFDSNGNDFFLLYLLSNVFGFEIYDDLVYAVDYGTFDVIECVIFLERLREAYSDGLFKVYREFKYNDYSFKGKFDVTRHIRINTPFIGRTAYLNREFTYDNDLLCMLRQTIEYIKDKYAGLWDSYSNKDSIYSELEKVLEEATPSYIRNFRYELSSLCRKRVSHPLYWRYENVRIISLRILNGDGNSLYEEGDNETNGFLIDMSWLWEEFVAVRLLEDLNYRHLRTMRGRAKEGLYYSEGKLWYPDFIENKSEKRRRSVLDAKYKHWDYERNDMHQLLAYLFLSGGTYCGAIFPVNSEKNREKEQLKLKPYNDFYGSGEDVYCYKLPFVIPNDDNYRNFCNSMEKNIKNWKQMISNL